MSAIDQNSYFQLKNIHKHLFSLGEPVASRENFIRDWWNEEDAGIYHLGVPDYHDRSSLVYLVHAAQALNSGERTRALELLRIAVENIEAAKAVFEQFQPS